MLTVIPAFALTALILAMVPGQGVAMVLRQSLVGGRSAAFYSVAGNSTGLLIWGAMSAVGLSAVFAVAFIPQFVPKGFNLGLGIFTLACVQATTSTLWYSSLIMAVHKSSTFLARPRIRRTLTAISAVGIIILALGLAVTNPR